METWEKCGRPLRVHAIFANHMAERGVAYTVSELLDNMQGGPPGAAVEPLLWFPQGDANFVREYHRRVFPSLAYRVLCKVGVPQRVLQQHTVRTALSDVRPGDVVYIWPPYANDLIKGAKDKGAVVIAERINCVANACERALRPAFERTNTPWPEVWSVPAEMAEEGDQMRACDFVTAPGPFVGPSLIEIGVPAEKIIESSYGWSPARLAKAVGIERPKRKVVFTFVGTGNIRKGLDLLLETWARANVDGVLAIAGKIDDNLREKYKTELARSDVRLYGHVSDIAAVYAHSDVMVFPSHEEGGPQVTYEAIGTGLPCIVSPMGGGRAIRHGVEGLVIDPYDGDGWAEGLHSLANDHDRRLTMGRAAMERSALFTWKAVGARLRSAFVGAARGSPADTFVQPPAA